MTVDEIVEARKVDYQLCFGSPAGQRVLEDLARVCFVSTLETAFAGGTNETMMRLGCQEVFRHICLHLGLTTEQLIGLYVPGRKTKTDGNAD